MRSDIKKVIRNKIGISLLIYLCAHLFFCSDIASGGFVFKKEEKSQKEINRGLWVTVFSEGRVLYSKDAATRLMEFCKKSEINEIYLQLYRAGQAYYDSSTGDRTRYEEILKTAGTDTLDFLLKEANKNKIKVFAWINVLSVGQNREADVIAKFGSAILTKDQYLRPSLKGKEKESDKYYLREEQLFLEPGDRRVVKYTLSIVDEIITRYPAISGIHLDYIRYPNPLPFIPDSRFNKYGLSYGYGEDNIARFKKEKGLDPLTMKDERDNCLLWDNWKREQITGLVEKISKHVKSKSPNLLISCAVLPSPERAYSTVFQDWSSWLEKGIINYVVLMNYTTDNRLAEEITMSALSHRGGGRIYVGLGAFLMRDKPQLFSQQYKAITDLNPDGIVFFSYDDIK